MNVQGEDVQVHIHISTMRGTLMTFNDGLVTLVCGSVGHSIIDDHLYHTFCDTLIFNGLDLDLECCKCIYQVIYLES